MGIGLWEILILMGIALVVMGPEKFPDFAKLVFRTVRELRGYVDDMKREISQELRPVQREINDLQRYNPEQYIDALTKETKGPSTSVPKQPSPPPTAAKSAAPKAQTPETPPSPSQPAPESGAKAATTPVSYKNPYLDGETTAAASSASPPAQSPQTDAAEAPSDTSGSETAKPAAGVRPSTPPRESRPTDGYDD